MHLVIAAHGTENLEGQAVVHDIARRVGRTATGPEGRFSSCQAAFVDVCGPTLQEVLDNRGSSGQQIVVVPLFLGSGYHVEVDIPEVVTGRDGVHVTTHLGTEPALSTAIIPALVDRVKPVLVDAEGTTIERHTGIVLAAAGSRRPDVREQYGHVAQLVANATGRNCTYAVLSGPGPTIAAAAHALRANGAKRIVVMTYLLAPGVFQDRAIAQAADLDAPCTPAFGDDPGIAHAVLSLAASAA